VEASARITLQLDIFRAPKRRVIAARRIPRSFAAGS
jgi:hypothetical protein